MAEYGLVYKNLWRKERFCNMSDDAQKLLNFLFAGPYSNMIGIHFLYKYTICGEPAFQWLPERLDKPFQELLNRQWIKYDELNRVLLINNWFEHHSIQNENMFKKALSELSEVPTSPLFEDFITQLKSKELKLKQPYAERLAKSLRERLAKQLSKPFGKPLPTVTVTETVTRKKEKEIYKEKEKSEKDSEEPPPPPDYDLTKKEIKHLSLPEVDKAWFEMIDQEQVKKWGGVKISHKQASTLISKFKGPDVLIAAIRACPPDLNRHYDYLKKIANDPQSVEVYTKKAELEVNPPPEVKKMMEAIIKTNQDTSSS
jgi:hypothetical protein